MKFKNYLIESVRTTEIENLDDVIELLNTKCKKNVNDFIKTENYIYRGFNTNREQFLLGDSNKGKSRISAHTNNYYTLLIDNSKYWKDYPKRSKSFICSNEYDYTNRNGELYYVIPYDGTKIGVCKENGIWISFNYALGKNKDLEDFNIGLKSLFNLNDNYTSWDKLKNDIRKVKNLENVGSWYDESIKIFKNFFKNNIFKNKDFIDYWEEQFMPEKNGFDLVTDIKKIPQKREVWIQGNVVFIHNNSWDKVKAKIE